MKSSILIVDDNPKNLQLAASVLNPFYRLFLADSGEKAIKTAEAKIPDLILLDIMMPDINGFEVCKALKQNETTKKIPIIFITAKTEEEDISLAFELGGADYVTKPFKIKEVLARVKTQIDLKQAQNMLEKQNLELKDLVQNRDAFFSIIAHDLRSPFQGLLGFTKMLADDFDTFTNNDLNPLLISMHNSVESLYGLLNDLLDWVRLHRGAMLHTPQKLNLSEVITKSVYSLEQVISKKQIDMVITVDDKMIIYADEFMINSIFNNLLSNAIKFTNKGGKVSINAKKMENNFLWISINDNGIGMSKSITDRLFKINEQIGYNGTEGEKSNGLGLILTKDFVVTNGGRIWVDSIENKGSTFNFTLPTIKIQDNE